MSQHKSVKFKKRNVAGQCRAMRCKETNPLYEFKTADDQPMLLCAPHIERAQVDKQAAATAAPATWPIGARETGGDGRLYEMTADGWVLVEDDPAREYVAPTVEAPEPEPEFVATRTAVVVEHADVLAVINPVRDEYTVMGTQLLELNIGSQEQVDLASELLQQVKGKMKDLEVKRKSITKPLLDAKRAVDALFKPATEAGEKVERILKAGLAKFVESQRAEQVAQLAAGNHAEALAVEQPEMPAGVSTRTVWRWQVTDMNAVPREYLALDSAKVQAHVNTFKGQSAIPGIEAYADTGITASSK